MGTVASPSSFRTISITGYSYETIRKISDKLATLPEKAGMRMEFSTHNGQDFPAMLTIYVSADVPNQVDLDHATQGLFRIIAESI